MNEEELKEIWQADRSAPTIDFAEFRETLNVWHDKLRRKIRIDIGAQIVLLTVLLGIVWFYPKIFFIFWITIALTVWYIWEILRFYRQGEKNADDRSARHFLRGRLTKMKNFMRRVRLILYPVPLVLVPAGSYALGHFGNFSMTVWEQFVALLITIAVSEILSVVLLESYFKIFYASAIKELKDLLLQLDSD